MRETIETIYEHLTVVKKYTQHLTQEELRQNHLLQDALVRQVGLISRAARSLSAAFRQSYPKVDWAKLMNLKRELVPTESYGLAVGPTWSFLLFDLPQLRNQMIDILEARRHGKTTERTSAQT